MKVAVATDDFVNVTGHVGRCNGFLVYEIEDGKVINVENRENNLSVRVYIIDNGSGSAGIEEGHEVSHNLLIAVSEFDEEPNQNLFDIGPFFNPKFLKCFS